MFFNVGCLRQSYFRNTDISASIGHAGNPRQSCSGRALLGDDAAAAVAALRTEIDHPISRANQVEIVLDDQNAAARALAGAQRRPAVLRCRQNAGRWWARQRCRACLR